MTERPLAGRHAVVTGASRGVGLGIAHELGLAGATVLVTGRSRDGGRTTDGLPGTVDATAALVSDAGGRGIAVACDHRDDDDVATLADRVRDELGHIDLLINNVWGGYEAYDAAEWELSFWEQPLRRWDSMFDVGVRAHFTTTRALAPLMLGRPNGLVVNISAGDRGHYLGDVPYDVAKAAVERLAFAMHQQLSPHGVTALAVQPGFTRTERVTQHADPQGLTGTHSARFVGRCVVALATDASVSTRGGGAYRAGELAQDYDLVDVDGTRPTPFDIPGPTPPGR